MRYFCKHSASSRSAHPAECYANIFLMNEVRIRLTYTTFSIIELKHNSDEFEFSTHTIKANQADS